MSHSSKSLSETPAALAARVANAVLFLASPLADMIQGETLTVDGGAAVHA